MKAEYLRINGKFFPLIREKSAGSPFSGELAEIRFRYLSPSSVFPQFSGKSFPLFLQPDQAIRRRQIGQRFGCEKDAAGRNDYSPIAVLKLFMRKRKAALIGAVGSGVAATMLGLVPY